MAMTNSLSPKDRMVCIVQPFWIAFIRSAVSSGIVHSHTTSPTMHTGVRIVGLLYSRIQAAKRLIIPLIPPLSA